MIDIDKMTSDQWLNYREDLIDAHLAKGLSLTPDPNCKTCDSVNDYICFECECSQIDKGKSLEVCSVCSCEFSPEDEGGVIGEFGILPVAFCPTCLCCMMDMADQLRGEDDEQLYD